MAEKRVNEMDLLRFIAALAVVFYHYTFRGPAAYGLTVFRDSPFVTVTQYGFLGVHLFFMISGFVILMTASRTGFAGFIVSRAVRLYPAFWACCTLTFIATLCLGAPRFSASWSQYLANMTLLGGFAGAAPIDGVYWSLFIELHFYAMVLAVIVLRRMHQAQGFLVGWLIVSVALQVFPNAKIAFLLIGKYSGFFIGGATGYLVWSRGLSAGRALLFAGAWLLAMQQALSEIAQLVQPLTGDFSVLAMLAAVSAFFAIFAAIALRLTGQLGLRTWSLAGALTYPLYLLHQNIGYMLLSLARPGSNEALLLGGIVGVVLASSLLIHRQIERPLAAGLKRVLIAGIERWPGRSAGLPVRQDSPDA